MPFGTSDPVEGMSATQARGARIWVTETLGDALPGIPDRELDRLAADLLATADRLAEGGNQAANTLVGVLWARGIDIGVLDVFDP
jgi:hypothetical protein